MTGRLVKIDVRGLEQAVGSRVVKVGAAAAGLDAEDVGVSGGVKVGAAQLVDIDVGEAAALLHQVVAVGVVADDSQGIQRQAGVKLRQIR